VEPDPDVPEAPGADARGSMMEILHGGQTSVEGGVDHGDEGDEDAPLFDASDDGLDAVDEPGAGVDDLLDAAAEIAPDQAPSGAEVVATASRERELAQARRRVVMRALAEDLGDHGDVTTAATVPATLEGSAEVIARADGVVAGLDCLDEVFSQVDGRVIIERRVRDGDRVTRGDVVATVRGRLRSLLTGERTALNLLCHLSGIATATRRFVDAVDGTGVVIRDTRKTTPGLRLLEKDAVVAGGGTNHRIGLYDQLLVKDNHVIAAGGAGAAAQAAMERADGRPVQVEISRGDQLEEVLAAGVTDILLDNFTPGEVRELVTRTAFQASLEVSGNVTLDTVRAYADTGVDTIAVGAITHSAPWLDLAMDVRQAPAGEG
jgi:nicotinate-nucleotide pyrophosphorylase (carboxylating)